ncbi:aminodeoxychorismate synthase component I [Thalassotalea maritima]|uniref:aminodeoxychorismate synthase component I n=1 Tax=Thalassotalea maritima TaxID=3242416 RepID=UPI003527D267
MNANRPKNAHSASDFQLRTRPLPLVADIELVAKAFANQAWTIWLDSGHSEHRDSLYDILVFDPDVTITTSITSSKVVNNRTGDLLVNNDDPLTIIDEQMAKLFVDGCEEQADLPFVGGAVGYFAYDLGRRFENLPATSLIDISLPDMAIGIYSKALVYNRKTKQYTLLSWHDDLADLAKMITNTIKAVDCAEQNDNRFRLQTDWRANMSESAYRQKFSQVQEYLLSGDCYQINLAQRFSALYQGDEFVAYQTLRQANNAPFSAFMRLEHGSILSVSPERFLKISEQRVETKPIKGTRPRSHDPIIDKQNQDDLQHAPKDRAENLMIVDLLRNDIAKACVAGSVRVPSLFAIESFPAVHHLVSTIEGKLAADKHPTDLLRGAFPGGSITGAPKIRAMQIIEELEPHRRSVYCGSIGYISACGKMDTSITIRTLVCEHNTIHCWAGGGLVADSQVDSEYQETFDKVAKILPTLKQL